MTNATVDQPGASAWRDRLIVTVAYALAWGALLVNRGLYWDDWTLIGRSTTSLVDGFAELGMPWLGYVHAVLFSLPLPGLVGHVLVFGVYLAAALVFHAILVRVPGLGRTDALVAAFTCAVFPVNYARVALVDLPYGISLVAFLGATWLLVRSIEAAGPRHRLAALGLYVVSFSTASLLVLYAAPVALAATIAVRSGRMSLGSFVRRYADFLALPVVFVLLKSAFFSPSGVYEGYNALTIANLAKVPRLLISIPGQVLVEPMARAATVAGVVGLAAGVVLAVWLFRRRRDIEPDRLMPAPVLALIAVAVLGLGVFAYLAVGRVPTLWDWSSRHQLLVPLGAGLLMAAAARGVAGAGRTGPAFAVAVGLALGVSVVGDARTMLAYQADWFKQASLIAGARTIPGVTSARHIRVVDSSTEFNVLRRTYRFYEYNALFSEALGDTRRLVSDGVNEPSPRDLATFISRPAYRMDQYVPSPVDLEVRLSAPGGYPGDLQILRLVALEILGLPSWDQELSDLIRLESLPVGPPDS